MTKNMGSVDRLIRLVIAALAIYLYSKGILTGTAGVAALVVAAVFALTSLVSFCPLYRLVGISTCPTPKK